MLIGMKNNFCDIENSLKQGSIFLKNGNFDEAERCLCKIFENGYFFTIKKGIPRVKISTLFHWKKKKILYARAYSDLAMISIHQGNLAEAERMLKLSIKVFNQYALDEDYYNSLVRLGTMYRMGMMLDLAEEMYRTALVFSENKGDTRKKAECLGNIGLIFDANDNFNMAIDYMKQALSLYDQEETIEEKAFQVRQMGLTFLRSGDLKKATEYFDQAIDSFKKLNNLIMVSRVLNDKTLSLDGKIAIDCAKSAVEVANKTNDDFEIADNSLLYARLLLDDHLDKELIESLLFKSLELFKKLRMQNEIANASSTLGLMYLRLHDFDKAESFFKDSLYVEQRQHRDYGMASDYGNLGLISKYKGDCQRAREYWTKAEALFEQNGNTELALEFRKQIETLETDSSTGLTS